MFESKLMRILCASALFFCAGYYGAYARGFPSSEQCCTPGWQARAMGMDPGVPR